MAGLMYVRPPKPLDFIREALDTFEKFESPTDRKVNVVPLETPEFSKWLSAGLHF